MQIRIAGLIALVLSGASPTPAWAETTYIAADRLLDVERGRYIEAPLIRVDDGKVAQVGTGPAPAGATSR